MSLPLHQAGKGGFRMQAEDTSGAHGTSAVAAETQQVASYRQSPQWTHSAQGGGCPVPPCRNKTS